jgi:hypothetical protein
MPAKANHEQETSMGVVAGADEAVATERPLSGAEIAAFHRDGYVSLPGFFSGAEIEPLRRACLDDPTIGGRIRGQRRERAGGDRLDRIQRHLAR